MTTQLAGSVLIDTSEIINDARIVDFYIDRGYVPTISDVTLDELNSFKDKNKSSPGKTFNARFFLKTLGSKNPLPIAQLSTGQQLAKGDSAALFDWFGKDVQILTSCQGVRARTADQRIIAAAEYYRLALRTADSGMTVTAGSRGVYIAREEVTIGLLEAAANNVRDVNQTTTGREARAKESRRLNSTPAPPQGKPISHGQLEAETFASQLEGRAHQGVIWVVDKLEKKGGAWRTTAFLLGGAAAFVSGIKDSRNGR